MSSASIARLHTPTSFGSIAVWALREEALLTPKPALVDQRGSGAHSDLDLGLMLRSAASLRDCFDAMSAAALNMPISQALREELAAIGRLGEITMMSATGGSNSHRGAIWSIGLLLAASVKAHSPVEIARVAGQIASFQDRGAPLFESNGARACKKFKVDGARGQAMRGFPHIINFGLPQLRRSRLMGASENSARLDSLIAIMRELDDTCLLHRGGPEALHFAQKTAQAILDAGGTSLAGGLKRLRELDEGLRARNASPGGSADLLASTLFLDQIETNGACMEKFEFRYDAKSVIPKRAHVGVVGSGDLEVLVEPSTDAQAHVRIQTSVEGYGQVWKNVLDRFFTRFDGRAKIEINDFGATPGMVMLRLEQAAEELAAELLP